MAKGGRRRRFEAQRDKHRRARAAAEPATPPRDEADILAELRQLCWTPGFAHVVAQVIVRDNFVFYQEEMKPEDMAHLFGFKRLIRTEVATLIGYMIQGGIEAFDLLPDDPSALLAKVEALLEELHRRLSWPMFGAGKENFVAAHELVETLREPIFYGGESAFNFQYRDFAVEKFQADNPWLEANCGFTIEDAAAIVDACLALTEEQVTARWKMADRDDPSTWSLLPGFIVSKADLVARSSVAEEKAGAVIAAFSTPLGDNAEFVALNDYNRAVSAPLIALGEDRYAVLQHYAPVEALYEAPMYWMFKDKAYRATAATHRGDFTEAFTHQRLIDVFGAANVHRGLNLDRAKGDRIGEIDILVEFGGRLLLVQAKSKRLTIEARRGNERILRSDFKRAVQDAYDQAQICAEALFDPSTSITRADGMAVTLQHPPQKIYPICLVSDHYPSLVFQTDRFLEKRDIDRVAQPIVTDIFALDAISELLDRPLRFLGYCELRDRFVDRLIYSHELVLLACHVRQNLWISDDFCGMMLDDSITGTIEIAMLARRRGIAGEKTPKGPLTAFAGTAFDGMLKRIEERPEPPLIDLALYMLEASGTSIKAYNEGVGLITAQTLADLRLHDFSFAMGGEGLTVHSSYEPPQQVRDRLEAHLEARKYACKADRWFGLFVDPADGLPLVGFSLAFPWKYDPLRAELARDLPLANARSRLPKTLEGFQPSKAQRKIGRNDPCFCGSGRKYKKCCRM
ncbi:YecA family protein [Novosphingobium tardum]|uniref:YecA family protein n=1 Tax=Novosphingobium tardum TaxID=1538021 RepID=A0ABV8RTF5_9SPHN